jgi:glycosyltransferase involved in cell wall biosynthesis
MLLISHRSSVSRIGLDMHVFEDLHQGSRTHCLELFSRVVLLSSTLHFVVLVAEPARLLESYPAFGTSNVEIVKMPHRSSPARLLMQIPVLAHRHRFDLLHTQYITPLLSPCATAVTIHDVLFESHPEFFGRFFTLRSKLLMRRSAHRSSLVFTVSEFSRNEIIEKYGLEREDVVTIANGVDSTRFFPGDHGASSLRTLGITPRQYLLTVGRLEPRKNHVGLLRAYACLSKPRPKLVIVGQRDFRFSEVMDVIADLSLKDDVVILEGIDDNFLPIIYRNALLFIYPTWAEGFGMPVLEAMASGVPVITSRTTSLPEVGGNAALYVQPENTRSIEQAINLLRKDPDLRGKLAALGLIRAKELNWDASAAVVSNAYQRFLTKKANGATLVCH